MSIELIILRLSTIDLDDKEFARVLWHLDSEIRCRTERDCNVFRLFFSTLSFNELVLAQDWFEGESRSRLADAHNNANQDTQVER